MPTVGDSVKRLTGNRKRIYEYMEECWINESYLPPMRVVAQNLFIPFSTVIYHTRKLREADLVYRIKGTNISVLRGATTSMDEIAVCIPKKTAYRKPGNQPIEET